MQLGPQVLALTVVLNKQLGRSHGKVTLLLARAVRRGRHRQHRRLLAENWTLVIINAARCSLPLRNLAADLADALKSRAWINAYHTPASNRGLRRHADDHHVFVWQQTGAKAWKVFAPGAAEDAEPLLDIVITAGEALYIPGGFPHSAEACEGQDSLHLTLGF